MVKEHVVALAKIVWYDKYRKSLIEERGRAEVVRKIKGDVEIDTGNKQDYIDSLNALGIELLHMCSDIVEGGSEMYFALLADFVVY